jgi:hypothetical protein
MSKIQVITKRILETANEFIIDNKEEEEETDTEEMSIGSFLDSAFGSAFAFANFSPKAICNAS